ncbi:desulfurization protein [Actinomycetospora endophytica]|uniref:Desulfurization protein n=1 Tax=Actinomycetospora endophytica TaxID=2291215 RepID=A0ABS8PC53_9PSEU|nr:acyl-CoA dehydrogenase family protein [Actinomycetospora endophytica]MCD2195842.1 desulfurization protein [Actinomycetospora endophytica]
MTLATDLPVTAPPILESIRALRPQLSDNGRVADRDDRDPGENLALLHDAEAFRLALPHDHGGTWDRSSMFSGWDDYVRAVIEICAGDSATGQDWLTTTLVCRELFATGSGLPEENLARIADRVTHEGLRLVASNAETGTAGKVTAYPVDGGVVLRGTKSFNSNSGGGGMAAVGCVLDGTLGRHQVLVELDDPAVELHDDWDNMGQRGTCSQTVTYHDVFVPDGWYRAAGKPPSMLFGAGMLLHGAILQGCGEGALDAAVAHVRTLDRGTLPQFADAAEDPLVLRRIGALSSRLAASRALLETTADRVAAHDHTTDTVVQGFRAKVAAVEAGLEASAAVHELTGARSTANAHGLDRFWRNARTFASHDPTDAKNVYIGSYEVTGALPAITEVFRL